MEIMTIEEFCEKPALWSDETKGFLRVFGGVKLDNDEKKLVREMLLEFMSVDYRNYCMSVVREVNGL